MSSLLLAPTLQSQRDEGRHPWLLMGCLPEGPEVQLEAVQRALLPRDSEVSKQAGPSARCLVGDARCPSCAVVGLQLLLKSLCFTIFMWIIG